MLLKASFSKKSLLLAGSEIAFWPDHEQTGNRFPELSVARVSLTFFNTFTGEYPFLQKKLFTELRLAILVLIFQPRAILN